MAQQATVQGAQAFIHRPQQGKPHQYRGRTYAMVCLGVDVSRHEGETKTAGLTLRAREGSTAALITRNLTADQCENLARALIDAAADIRHDMAVAAMQDKEPAELEGGAA